MAAPDPSATAAVASDTGASARLAALLEQLPAEHRPAFRRFGRELLAQAGSREWRLFIGVHGHAQESERIASAIETLLPGSRRLIAQTARHPDWLALEDALAAEAHSLPADAVIQVFGLEHWLDPLDPATTTARLRAANVRREAFARTVPVPVVFWLRESQVRDWVEHAPDLWSWRSGMHAFADPAAPLPPSFGRLLTPRITEGIDNLSGEQRRQRIAELAEYLQRTADQPDSALRLDLYDELADLLASIGELDRAWVLRGQQIGPMAERLRSEREVAINRGKVADILQARGQLDEALRIRLEEELPVYERLGDVQGIAAALFNVASIRLNRSEHETQEGFIQIFNDLHRAYGNMLQLHAPDGIAAVGNLYAQILALGQAFDQALEVLTQVDDAWARLGNEAGRQQVAALRQQIEAARGAGG